MSIEYSWKIYRLDFKSEENNLLKVVKRAYWEYTANNGVVSATTTGFENVYNTDENNFTVYEELTEAKVKSWIESKLNHWAIKKDLQDRLIHQLNYPDQTAFKMPWDNTPDSEESVLPVENSVTQTKDEILSIINEKVSQLEEELQSLRDELSNISTQ